MAKFKKGDAVRAIGVIPEGPVVGIRMDDEGDVSYLITWVDADGDEQSRWFSEAALVAM